MSPSTSERSGGGLLAGAVWLHRWSGIALSLLFALWFATGAVMVFVPFPSLGAGERAAHSDVIRFDGVRLGPPAAGQAALRLVSVRGVPAYIVERDGQKAQALSADDGKLLPPLTRQEAAATAARFSGRAVRSVAGPFDYDQWIVHQQFDPLRPFYRVRLADEAATDLYVSARTGEIVQRTTRSERLLNWAGSIIHWIYFTPIRSVFERWDWTVWIVSLVGVATTTLGLWLGVDRTLRRWRARRPGVSPFKGWLKWHHILGLVGGVFLFGWILSGWLSMDHGRLFSRGEPTAAEARAFKGPPGEPVAPRDLRRLGGATIVEFQRIAGREIAVAHGPGPDRVLVGGPAPALVDRLSSDLVRNAIGVAWPHRAVGAFEPVKPDAFLARAEDLYAGTILVRLRGPDLRLYLNGVSGKLLVVMDRSREAYAWLYYGLHTYNFPGLAEHPIIRIVVLSIPLVVGFLLSITSVIVGVRRLFMSAPKRA